MSVLLWIVVPYVALTTFIVGHWWRYKYDKFGWTTRSSQVYESRLLRIGSPLFHFGILFVVIGHVMGLIVPKTWTDAVGLSEGAYHAAAVGVGGIAGVATVVGLAILIYRRRTVGPVFSATTVNDKIMYVFLATVISIGIWNTVHQVTTEYDYRETVSLWFRGVLSFNVKTAYMSEAPLAFQVHALVAMGLFAMWPFTRLVHVFSAPVGYLARPYVVYRSRDVPSGTGSRANRPGWEPSTRKR